MKRGILAACCVLAMPTAVAWAPCKQKGLTPPKPIHREAPAYRDGLPIPATALLTLRFDPARATCPDQQRPVQKPPDRRPAPRVTRHDGKPARRAESWAALSPGAD